MKFTWRKAISLGLCLCMVLGLLLPAAGSADAAEYDFPEYGAPTYLGEHITGRTMREYADHISYGGEDYLLMPLYGGKLYIFRLSQYLRGETLDSWVYDMEDTGFTVPEAIDSYTYGTTPKVFVSGGGNALKIYSFSPDNDPSVAEIETFTLSADANINAISVDTYGNVFLAANYNGAGRVYRLTWDGSTKTFSETLLYETTQVSSMANIVTGDRESDYYVYAQGTLTNGGSYIYKIHYTKGSSGTVTSVQYPNTGGLFYLSYAGGMLFGGTSQSSSVPGDGFICVDTATMTKSSINIVKDGQTVTGTHLIGVATEPENGISYMNIAGVGLCQYDTATNTATFLRTLNPSLRVRSLYHYNGGTYLMTMTISGSPYLFPMNGSASLPSVTAIVNEGVSNWIARTLAAGPESGAAVYIGGYLTPSVASFDPDAATPLTHVAFSQGHAQTDSMIAYKGKLYAGCYSGAYLVEYDPATGAVTDLIPGGLHGSHQQLRIHGLAAGDDKIFFSTVPTTGQLGGCIGWYDLNTQELYVERNVVQNQILISLAYDEGSDILYGASSVSGGSNATATATEAVILAYDVASRTGKSFSIRNSGNSNSDLGKSTLSNRLESTSLYNMAPRYISGISIDPDGKLWGNVYNTVFSFSYNKSAGTMTVKEEWYSGYTTSVPYTSSGSYNWFPQNFYFDDNGYMYVAQRDGKLYRLSRSNPSSNPVALASSGRAYTMGSDGNIYYAAGYDLYRVSLNRVSIAEDLIYAANADDAVSIATAEKAYNSLSDAEQAEVGSYYYEKLQTLSGEECLINGTTYTTLQDAMATAVSGDTVKLLVSQICDVTVANGVTLDLGGKTITGKVTVANGKVDLNGGSITGDLTVVNGTVEDTTDGKGSVTGKVELQQDNGGYLPLFDGNAYRFYAFQADSLATGYDEKKINQVNFWFDLRFTNQKAYGLLSGGNASNLQVWAELYVDGKKIDADVVFDAKLMEWAGQDHTGQDNWALYVAVTNMPASAQTVSIKPCLSANGMTVSMGEMTHTVKLPTGEAIFGAFPKDLIK